MLLFSGFAIDNAKQDSVRVLSNRYRMSIQSWQDTTDRPHIPIKNPVSEETNNDGMIEMASTASIFT